MSTKTTGMTLAKASPNDFKVMWKINRLVENYGYDFYPDDRSPRAVRVKSLLMARMDQLGTGGFMRIVMGCEMLIENVCDPAIDHLALKPVYGAAPELMADLQQAAATLRGYEALHRAKGTTESDAKAEVNAALAARFEATIAKATMVTK